MRKLIVLLAMHMVIMSQAIFAQAPQAFKYQAVVRNISGNILTSQNVSFRISILLGSASGPTLYTETQNATTNQFGLVNLNIGMGAPVSGTFSAIGWGSNSHFVQIEFDATGGTNYSLIGTSQLLSVPYALYAKESGNSSPLTVGTTQVFDGIAPTTWTDLDLSSVSGANYAMVTLKVTNLSTSATEIVNFKQKNDPETNYTNGTNVVALGTSNNGVAQAIIYTNISGFLQWKSNLAVHTRIEVVAFVK